MTETRPAPLVPADTDLRRYLWFPLPVAEITRGAWWLNATPSAKGVMLTLMCEAWHQIPAASLPSDRRSLTRLGHVPSKTGRVMAEIMSEWVMCSDGRLYHPMLAESAISILDNTKKMTQKTAAGRAKLAEKRASVTDDRIEEIRKEDIESPLIDPPLAVAPDAPAPKMKSVRRGLRLPADWQPSDQDRQYATGLGLSVNRIAEDFRGYWLAKPGEDAEKLDWSLTWRGWCRREAEWRGTRSARADDAPPPPPRFL